MTLEAFCYLSVIRKQKLTQYNFQARGPEEKCLSLEHQNPSKTSEKMGYFDRVSVSLHVLFTANQETRARKIGLQYKYVFFYSALRVSVALRATCRAPARIWLAVIDFQNGEQQSRSGSDKTERRNRS